MITYQQVFSKLKRPALIPFFVIGDPDFDTSLALVKKAIDSGADILELGIAFSDPIADGPTIQKADIRAMKAGITVAKAIEFIAAVKKYKDIPIGLLLYYNLVFQYGVQKFFHDFHNAGVNGVLIADLSIDDADEITTLAADEKLDTVFMVTPNTEHGRTKLVVSKTTGFIYAVSLLGVTGSRENLSTDVSKLVQKLKDLTSLPICVGFGISKPDHASAVAKAGADGVIIGSAIVSLIENNLDNKPKMLDEVAAFLSGMKAAIETIKR